MFEWTSAGIGLAAIAALLAVLQILWIAALLQRNRRRRLSEPLSPRAFHDELERIFRQS